MQRGKTIFTVFFVCLFLSVAAAAPTVTFTFTDVHATKTINGLLDNLCCTLGSAHISLEKQVWCPEITWG